VQGVQRRQYGGLLHDMYDSHHPEHDEPQHDDRAEVAANERGTEALHEKQADEDGHRDGYDIGLERRRD